MGSPVAPGLHRIGGMDTRERGGRIGTEAAELAHAVLESAGEGGLWAYDRYLERPADRARRIARKAVDPETAAALRRLWR